MGIDLRLYAKPGKEGQIYVSMDSLILFLREESKVPGEIAHADALSAVADTLEGELAEIKKQRTVIADVFGVGGESNNQGTPRGSSS